MNPDYLPLAAYSAKYSVSISTLRRRIKADDLIFLFEDGKYLIYDQPLSTHQRHRPSQVSTRENSLVSAHTGSQNSNQPANQTSSQTMSFQNGSQVVSQTGSILVERAPARPGSRPAPSVVQAPMSASVAHASRLDFVESTAKPGMTFDEVKAHEEKILSAANKLLTELKQAYTHLLSEKDLQILKLQQEIADLQTLVSVLEKNPALDPNLSAAKQN